MLALWSVALTGDTIAALTRAALVVASCCWMVLAATVETLECQPDLHGRSTSGSR